MKLTEKASPKHLKSGFFVAIVAVVTVMIAACLPVSEPDPRPYALAPMSSISTATPTNHALVTPQGTPTPTDLWLALLQKAPHPYTTPLPPQTPTALDGIYVMFVPQEGTPVPCRRCPDYLPEGGLWKLNLDKGIFRIFHQATGWRSLGSFTVSEDQLVIFNDPTCFETVGVYNWKLEAGKLSLSRSKFALAGQQSGGYNADCCPLRASKLDLLSLEVIEDTCQVDRRARSFSQLAWVSCQPPSTEAAITNHWPQPPGCESGE